MHVFCSFATNMIFHSIVSTRFSAMKLTFNKLFSAAVMALMFVVSASTINAQGTEGSGIILRVTIDGISSDYYSGNCGYSTANWGGTFSPDNVLCGNGSWGYDITPDSLGCDSIPAGQLTGKVALIRRGVCGFGIKAYNAQLGGAVAVLVAQIENAPTTDDCFVQAMGATQPQSGLTTIPALFICRKITNQIDAAIKAGKVAEVCFVRPDVALASHFFPVSHVQTPLSQIAVDTFGFGATLTNLHPTITRTNASVTAQVVKADGTVLFTETQAVASLAPGDSAVIDFTGQFIPNLGIGTYAIKYFTSADPIGSVAPVSDRISHDFLVTTNLFAQENGATGGLRPGSLSDTWRVGAVYSIAPGTIEKYICNNTEFAFATNADDYPVTDVEALHYIFKVNDDVLPDFSNFEDDGFFSSSLEWMGFGQYDANPAAVAYKLEKVAIENVNTSTPGLELEAGARYFVMVEYLSPLYLTFNGFNTTLSLPGVSTVLHNNTWFLGGFSGDNEAVVRMYLDLANKTDDLPLAANTMQIVPNPVVDVLNLAITFDEPTNATITIADINGRVITYENRKAMTSDLLHYPLSVAPGTYLARIATEKGTLTKKFIVVK